MVEDSPAVVEKAYSDPATMERQQFTSADGPTDEREEPRVFWAEDDAGE